MTGVQTCALPIFDAETGLRQNWNQDYAPGIGRYIQADPIGLIGMNVYQYARGNPMAFYDSLGKIVLPITIGFCGIAGGFIK